MQSQLMEGELREGSIKLSMNVDSLFGNSCALGWPFVLIVFCLFFIFISHFGFKSECHHNSRARGDQPGCRR